MPFQKGDPRAAAAARKGQNIRWAKATPEQRAENVRTLRDAQAAKYVERATATLERMGIASEFTPEQVAEAANALQKTDLRERLAKGRERKAELASQEDAWNRRVAKLAGLFIDGLVRELGLIPDMAATVAKVAYSAMADEFERPQAERDFQRLRRRWEDYRLYVHESHCPTHKVTTCLICGLGLGEEVAVDS
jgi:hypothetical protein